MHSSWSDVIEVLQPFEVTDGNTTSVTEDVGQEFNTLGQKDLFGFHSGWAVGCFNDQFAFKSVSVVGINRFFNGSWDKEVTELD